MAKADKLTLHMRKMKRSLGYALTGFRHALTHERNIQFFLAGYFVILLLGALLRLLLWEWIAILFCGGLFLVAELLNTALEHLADVFDDHRKVQHGPAYLHALKNAKDVAAAASLAALLTTIVVVCIVFWPYVELYWPH